jgi:hypothetical protein
MGFVMLPEGEKGLKIFNASAERVMLHPAERLL